MLKFIKISKFETQTGVFQVTCSSQGGGTQSLAKIASYATCNAPSAARELGRDPDMLHNVPMAG